MTDPSASTSRSRRSTLRTWSLRVGLGLLAIPVVWLLTINLALWTGVVEAVVSGERTRSTLRLRHGWAWCVWPTRVHVNDLTLAIDGARWQMELNLPEGEVEIELHELFSRRFEASKIRGEHARIALAFKAPAGTPPSELEGYPRIEGFPEPVLDDPPRPEPEHRWEIAIAGAECGLDRLQVDAFELELDGRLALGLDVEVLERLGLPTLGLEVAEGELRHRDAVVAEALQGEVSLTLASYDPTQIRGRSVLRQVSGDVALRAAIPGLEWVGELAPDLPVSAREGRGELEADVSLTDGVVVAGSHLVYQTESLQVVRDREKGDPLVLDSGVFVKVKVSSEGEGEGEGLLAQAELVDFRAGVVSSDSPWLLADQLSASTRWSSADLVEGPGSMVSASADLPAFTMPDLGQLGRVGDELRLRGGAVAGHASVRSKDDASVFSLDFAADVDGLALGLGDSTELRSDGYIRSEGKIERSDEELVFTPMHAKLSKTALKTKHGDTNYDWLEVDRATIRYDRANERLTADLQGRFSDLRSVLAHVRPGQDLFDRLPRVGMGTTPVNYSMQVTRTSAGMQIDVDRFEGSPLDVQAAIFRGEQSKRIAVYFRRAKIGLTTRGNGSRDIDVAAGADWFGEKQGWVHAGMKP